MKLKSQLATFWTMLVKDDNQFITFHTVIFILLYETFEIQGTTQRRIKLSSLGTFVAGSPIVEMLSYQT